jgi:hypothetical protein
MGWTAGGASSRGFGLAGGIVAAGSVSSIAGVSMNERGTSGAGASWLGTGCPQASQKLALASKGAPQNWHSWLGDMISSV